MPFCTFFVANTCVCELFSVILRRKILINDYIMATYTLTINERSTQGKALLAYLEALKINIRPATKATRRKGSFERSIEDIKHGRVETFSSVDDMFKSLGI